MLGEVCGGHGPSDNRLPPLPLCKGSKLKQGLAELGPESWVPPLGAVLHAPKYNPFSIYATQSLCHTPTRGWSTHLGRCLCVALLLPG